MHAAAAARPHSVAQPTHWQAPGRLANPMLTPRHTCIVGVQGGGLHRDSGELQPRESPSRHPDASPPPPPPTTLVTAPLLPPTPARAFAALALPSCRATAAAAGGSGGRAGRHGGCWRGRGQRRGCPPKPATPSGLPRMPHAMQPRPPTRITTPHVTRAAGHHHDGSRHGRPHLCGAHDPRPGGADHCRSRAGSGLWMAGACWAVGGAGWGCWAGSAGALCCRGGQRGGPGTQAGADD